MRLRLLKNYFLEIWLFFVATIVTTMILLSLILYGSFETATAHMINELNQDFLNETRRINEYLQKMIKISGMELFFEPAVRKLMVQEDPSNFEVITGIRRLNSIQSMGLHTHSIYVYNAAKRYVYATSNRDSDRLEDFYDRGLPELLSLRSEIRRLAPIPRIIREPSGPTPVYSFVFSDDSFGALVYNITIGWLEEVLGEEQDSQSTVMFVDRSGQIAYHSDHSFFLHDARGEAFFARIAGSPRPAGFFVQPSPAGRQLVFYSTSEDGALYLIRLYPYHALMGGIEAMRRTTWLVVILFVSAGIGIAFAISKRLYRPIGQLVRVVDAGRTAREKQEGDLGYLSSTIEQMISRNVTLEAVSESYRLTLQREALREILLGKAGPGRDAAALFGEYGLPFDVGQPFEIVAVKGVGEIGQEDLPSEAGTRSMVVPLPRSGTVVLFQGLSLPQERRFVRLLQERGARIIICSGRVEHVSRLSRQVLLMEELLRLSFFYEKGSVLSSRELRKLRQHVSYPVDLEKLLLHHLRQGSAADALGTYRDFIGTIRAGSYDHFRFSVKRLFLSLQVLVQEMQLRGLFAGHGGQSMDDLERFLDGMDSIAELEERFARLFSSFEEEVTDFRLKRNRRISEEILALIEREYANPNLSLQYICDAVGLSPSYVSRVFKDITSASVAESILACRIGKAKRLLLDESVPAREIAARVGFINENYFYTVFRKKTGQTPHAFRTSGRGPDGSDLPV